MEVCLKRGEERDIQLGTSRIYDNEIDWYTDTCQDGQVVEVLDSRHRFVARGFFNSKSKIVVRVLTRDPKEEINREFFQKRLIDAWNYRKSIGLTNSCRLIFGDSDGLPGLTVDKFGDYLSLQIVSLGMEQWKSVIIELLAELLAPKGIYIRNDLAVRLQEGLPLETGCVWGYVPDVVEIQEHDARMLVNIPSGQKTGHFLDQQENRAILKDYVLGKTVLDLCCCTGGFSVHAGLYGATHVDSVDASQEALTLVQQNATLNNVACVETICGNVFDLVHQYCDAGRKYDVVILDPPAFAKSRKALDSAYRGYKELNYRAMQLVVPGGFLLTFSCSRFMTKELFLQMVRDAAVDSGRHVRLVQELMQARDHPATTGEPASLYLKGWVLHVTA